MYTFHSLTVSDIRQETDDTVSVAFAVPECLAEEYRFEPGQHLTFRIFRDGEEVRRSFSICSGIQEGELRVAIKHLPGGRFSEWVHTELRRGMSLDVMTPAGRFTTPLDPGRARHYLGVAAGSGITPVIGILKSVLACEPHSRFTLIYGNRTVNSIIFREQLADLKDRYLDRLQVFHILSRQHQDVPLFNGRITGDKLRALCCSLVPPKSIDEVFLCGPEPMTIELRQTLLDLGLDSSHVHLELFGTPYVASRTAGSPNGLQHQVTVVLNGIRTELAVEPGDSVLEAGLAAGLDLPFSCRGGVCATCRARVTEGEVKMATNYALEPWETERGFVLTCQSRPVTDRVLVDYDQT